jgi:hypothetical protein
VDFNEAKYELLTTCRESEFLPRLLDLWEMTNWTLVRAFAWSVHVGVLDETRAMQFFRPTNFAYTTLGHRDA